MRTTVEALNLLVIEDDFSEQKLIRLLSKDSGYSINIKFLKDGEEALEFISTFPSGEEIFKKIHLILLDLNIPKVNGIEILLALKKSEDLKKIPVVILTTSHNRSDVEAAYYAGASGYIRKPSVIEEYESVIKKLFYYWFELCLIP